MENLKVLALGRNQIKKIENLDSVAESLEELWISYNVLEKLVWCCQILLRSTATRSAHCCHGMLMAKDPVHRQAA